MSRLLFVLTAVTILALSCSQPVLIGSDFLGDEKSDLQFEDHFSLSFFTHKTDSIIVHSDNVTRQLLTYLCGEINDPVFGHYSAEIFAQPILPTIGSSLVGSTLDSVILLLRYDTLGSYGTLVDPVSIDVYRMIELPEFTQEYYSNKIFQTSPDLLGSVTLVPQPRDSVTLISPTDTVTLAPHIRVPLDLSKMQEFVMEDSITYENQDSFLAFFNGLNIKMSGGGNTILGFNLLNSLSGVTFYFKKDTVAEQFKFIFTTGSVKTVHMVHDYTGSMVEAALTPEPELDYWFIQGLSGVTDSVRIDGLSDLGNVIINQAELDIYCTFPEGDMGSLYPPCPYVVTQDKTDSTLVNSIDVNIALAAAGGDFRSGSYALLYGGKPSLLDPGPPVVYHYNMLVTNQINDIYKGLKENPNKNIIYFNPLIKANVPSRAVMFGPNHPLYAPRLKVYYTVL